MALIVERMETWVGAIKDEIGSLQPLLAGLAEAGVALEFVQARRAPEKKDTGRVYVTPIRGVKDGRAARKLGFAPSSSLHTIRVEGRDKPGRAAGIAAALVKEGISIQEFVANRIGSKFVAHIVVDSTRDVGRAVKALKHL